MAKLSKEELARRDGMKFALKIAKEKGIEGLEEEIKYRGINGRPQTLDRAAIHDFENRTRDQITDCIEAMAVWVLHNEFGFGQKRCLKFMKRFMDETECLVSEHISWKDIIDVLHTQIKTDIRIRLNEVGGVVTIEPDDIEL